MSTAICKILQFRDYYGTDGSQGTAGSVTKVVYTVSVGKTFTGKASVFGDHMAISVMLPTTAGAGGTPAQVVVERAGNAGSDRILLDGTAANTGLTGLTTLDVVFPAGTTIALYMTNSPNSVNCMAMINGVEQ